MITAILDTNVFVQALSSSPQSASSRVVAAYFDHRVRLVFSSATFDELIEVLALPRIKVKHGLSDDEIIEFTESLWDHAVVYRTTRPPLRVWSVTYGPKVSRARRGIKRRVPRHQRPPAPAATRAASSHRDRNAR